jgi:predicted transposase YbfD/YdcC
LPKKTLETAIETANNTIVQVKENQKFLLRSCEETGIQQMPVTTSRTNDHGHGRKESRTVEVFANLASFSTTVREKWESCVKSVIRVTRARCVFNTKTKEWDRSHEVSFYIATMIPTAHDANRLIRAHWFIENKNHYVRDVSMGEDASRIRTNADAIARLRSFALNILRANGETNIKQRLYKNSLNLENVLSYQRGL